jgi:hypothetical protein
VRIALVLLQTYVLDESDSSESGALCLSHSLDENAIQALVQCGLQKRFPREYSNWAQRNEEVRRNLEAGTNKEKAAIAEKLAGESAKLEKVIRQAIVNAIINTFRCVAFIASTIVETHITFKNNESQIPRLSALR